MTIVTPGLRHDSVALLLFCLATVVALGIALSDSQPASAQEEPKEAPKTAGTPPDQLKKDNLGFFIDNDPLLSLVNEFVVALLVLGGPVALILVLYHGRQHPRYSRRPVEPDPSPCEGSH